MDDIILTPVPSVLVRPLGDGAILLDSISGSVYQLNRVGVEVWELLSSATTAAVICDTLATRYSLDRGRVERDVERLLAGLRTAGLVSPRG
jgi:PqqD family protein of HPr-rel-A system